MILGLKTAAEAKIEAQLMTAIRNNPVLNKAESIIQMLADYQKLNPTALFVNCNIKVPTLVANQLNIQWGYIVTSTPTTKPDGWTGYNTTWVQVTKVDWS